MGLDKRLTILLTPAEYDELKRRAGIVPMSTWVRHQVLGVRTQSDESGDGKNLRKPGAIRVAQQGAGASKRTKRVPSEPSAPSPALPYDPRTGSAEGMNCAHDYGPEKCPFPQCVNHRWRKK